MKTNPFVAVDPMYWNEKTESHLQDLGKPLTIFIRRLVPPLVDTWRSPDPDATCNQTKKKKIAYSNAVSHIKEWAKENDVNVFHEYSPSHRVYSLEMKVVMDRYNVTLVRSNKPVPAQTKDWKPRREKNANLLQHQEHNGIRDADDQHIETNTNGS